MNNQKKTNIQELMVISLKFQISNFEQIKFSPISTNFPVSCQIRFLKNFWIFSSIFHPFSHWPFSQCQTLSEFWTFPAEV